MNKPRILAGGFGPSHQIALADSIGLIERHIDAGVDWFDYTPGPQALELRAIGGTVQYIACLPRLLSRRFLTAIIRPFALPSTAFEIELPQGQQEPSRYTGLVHDCQYGAGGLHIVTLQFERPVDVAALRGPLAADAEAEQEPKPADTGPRVQLNHPVLVVLPDDDEWSEIEPELQRAGAQYERVTALGPALDLLRSRAFGAVITDSLIDDINASGVLHRLSATDYTGPLLLLDFDDASEQDRTLPPHRVLLRPMNATTLVDTLDSMGAAT
ncbi:MAG: hypothetical protein AAGK04_11065 [Planctomycetota bacterium]